MASIHWAGKNGDWATKADWTGGVVPGAGDDVFFDGSAKFTATINSAEAAHSITISDASATVDDTGTLTVGTTLAVTAGTFELTGGGTIAGGTLSATGGAFAWTEGNLSGVTYEGTLILSGSSFSQLYVANGFTVTGANGTGPGTINLTGNGQFGAAGGETLNNINMTIGNSNESDFELNSYSHSSATLTLGNNFDISQAGKVARLTSYDVYGELGDGITNNGSITAGFANGSFYINPTNFTNNGTILAINGDTLDIEAGFYDPGTFSNFGLISVSGKGTAGAIAADAWTNFGTITVGAEASLSLGGAFSTASLNGLTNSGGTVGIAGTLNNAGATLNVGAGTNLGTLALSGTISGGTIADAGSGFVFSGGYLSGVTFQGPLDMSAASSRLTITSAGITLEGAGGTGPGTVNLTGTSSTLYLAGKQTLDNATVNIGATSGTAEIYGGAGLTLGANLTVSQTIANSTAEIYSYSTGSSVVNAGTINAAAKGGRFEISNSGRSPGTFVNSGTMTASNGDDLIILSAFVDHGVMTDAGGTITLDGTLANAGSVFNVGTAAPGGPLTLTLSSGAISGGTVVNSGSGFIFSGGYLSGVTFQGPLDMSAASSRLTITSAGIVLEGAGGTGPGTVNLTGTSSTLYLQGRQTLDNATVNIGATTGRAEIYGGAGLTLGANLTVSQTIANSTAEIYSYSTGSSVVNAGTINAAAKGGHFDVYGKTFTNGGVITVANGDTFNLQPTKFANLAAGVLTGGSFEVDAGSKLQLATNVKVTTDAATIILSGSGSVLQGQATIDSTLATIAATGTLELLAGRNWSSTVSMTNAGVLQLGGGSFAPASLASTGTVKGFGTIATTFANSGLLSVDAGKTMSLVGGTLSNLFGSTLTGGTFVVGAGSTLQLANNSQIATLDATLDLAGAGATVQSLNTGTSQEVSLEAGLTAIGSAGDLEVLGGRGWSSTNALANSGVIQLGGGTFSSGALTDAAGSSLTGSGTLASAFTDNGAVTSSGGALAFTGTGDQFGAALAGTEIDFAGGTDALNAGSTLTASTVGLSGGAAVTLNASESFNGTWNEGAASVNLNGNTLTLSGASSFNPGATIGGPGTLLLVGDAASIDSTLSFGGSLAEDASSNLSIASGQSLFLSGATLNGTVGGAGTLALSGGLASLGAGALISVADVTLTGETVSLAGNLAYAGALSEDSASTLALGANTLTLSGAGSSLAGTVSGTGLLAFSGGTQAINGGANFSVASWAVTGGSAAAINTALVYGGSFSEDAASAIAIGSGDSLSLNGASSFAGAVSGAGMLGVGGALTLGADLVFGGAFAEASGASIALGSNTLTLSGAGSSLAGSASGAGTLAFAGGSQAVNAGASFTQGAWMLSGGDATTIDTNLSYAGAFSEDATSSVTVSGGDALTLSNATLAGAIGGAGSLAFSGGAQALNAGASIATAAWSVSGGATVSVTESLVYAGSFSEDATSSIAIAAGDALNLNGASNVAGAVTGAGTLGIGGALTLGGNFALGGAVVEATGGSIALGSNTLTLSGADTLAGSIGGAGTLAFSGGAQAINSGAAITAAAWSIGGGTTSINETLAFAGSLSEGAATVTVASGDTVTLSGPATFATGAVVNGAGTVSLANATIAGLTIGGTATLDDTGMVVETGAVTLGDATSAAAHLTIASGATWQLDGDVGIALGHAKGSAITVSGTLIKTAGTGVSVVKPAVTLNGVIEAASGTLDIAGKVSGKGAMKIDAGATLELDTTVSKTTTTTFAGASATLDLKKAAKMAGTIAGFTAGDTIDLLKTAATGATINGSDQLVITNGSSTVATLQLTGNYAGQTFTIASDGHGGSAITVSGGGMVPAFTAAMAGMGGVGSVVPTVAAAPAHPPPLLLAPH